MSTDTASSSPYTNLTPDVLSAFAAVRPWAQGNYQAFNTEVGQYVDNFKSQFNNLVGRDPTDAELQQFQQQFITPNVGNLTDPNSAQRQNVSPYIQQFVGQNFQQAANQTAIDKLNAQQTQANSLGDLFQSQGQTAISDTQQSLLDYQSQLFDRLRPNLLTSLKSQGLLDTGGLNEAVAGVQGDLANNASNYISQLTLNNEQQANAIRFGGASAPYTTQQQQITGQPGVLSSTANGATTFNNSTFMDQLNYQHQLGLIGAQASAQQSLQPSFLRTLGQSAATGLGTNLTQWAGPSAYGSGAGGQSGGSGMAALFA